MISITLTQANPIANDLNLNWCHMRLKTKLKAKVIYSIWIFIFYLCLTSSAFGVDALIMNILAVGHGDAIFIQFPNGSTMLVDGGDVSVGQSVVDFIRDSGYTKIDRIILTHTHDDHIGGLIAVQDNFEVGEVLESAYCEETPLYSEFRSRLEEADIPVTIVARDDTFSIDDVIIAILNPPAESTIQRLGGANNASIVMRLQYGDTSILLAADIEKDRDRELVQIYGDRLKSTVLKCSHHGSEVSNSEEFLKSVQPSIGVVSTGPSHYNYPSQTTMERIESLVPAAYRTDRDGTVVVMLDGKDVMVEKR